MDQLIVRVSSLAKRLATVGWLAGSIACSDEGPAVPFKLDPPSDNTQTPTTPGTDPIDEHVVEVPGNVDNTGSGQSFGANTQQIEAAGMTLRSDRASFLAALTLDLDRNGDDDVLVITRDDNGRIALQRALHDDPRLTHVNALHTLDKGCLLNDNDARLTRLSATHLSVTIDERCASDTANPNAAPNTNARTNSDAPGGITASWHWIFETALTPRLLERVRILANASATAPRVSLVLSGGDVDGDQNDDVIGNLSVGTQAGGELAVPLHWINRVGGLDLNRKEPEASFARALTAANALRDSVDNPAKTRALEQIVAAHRALCAEASHARIAISERPGLYCGRSKAVGSAWSQLAKVFATPSPGSPRRLHDALDAFDHLNDDKLTVNDSERNAIEQTLKTLASASAWQWQPGPDIGQPRAPGIRLPAIGFSDTHTLLLRGTTQQSYDIDTATLTTLSDAPGDRLMRDPTGKLAVVNLDKRCDGYRLSIVNAAQVDNGVVLGPSVAEPLIEALLLPATAACVINNAGQRSVDDRGFSVLGWTHDAIVIARNGRARAVPVNGYGHVTGPVADVQERMTPPAAAGAIAVDGSAYATLTPVGILLESAQHGAMLVAPLGPVSAQDIAVAPNGAAIAYVFGGRVFIGRPPGAAPSPDVTPSPTP